MAANAMNEKRYEFPYDDLEAQLLPLLRNRVFHVTKEQSYRGILESGYVDSNSDCKYPQNWRSDCYGRKRKFVCLFDLRDLPDQVIDDFRSKCDFLYDRRFGETSAYLILAQSCYQTLIPNNVAVSETEYKEFFVPRLEAWYPGKLAISNVQMVLLVKKVRPG